MLHLRGTWAMKYDYMQIITLPNRKGKYLALVKGNEMRVIARFINDESIQEFQYFVSTFMTEDKQ